MSDAGGRVGAEAVRRRRQATIWVAAGVVLVLACAGLIGWAAVRSDRPSVPTSAVTPRGLVDGSGVLAGTPGPSAKATVAVYEDFICPICERFEQVVGPDVAQLAAGGTARVVYHPVAILDEFSTTKYSTRALAAAGCAIDQGKFLAYRALLFAHQPAERSAGPSDAELARLGGQVAGMDVAVFTRCVTAKRYRDWAAKVSDEAYASGVHGTPTIKVNGKALGQDTVPSFADIKAAVDKANGR
ncbi:MAG: DsbA family protein [Mycobacteriales bacterium]